MQYSNTTLSRIKSIIEDIFPENKYFIIEQGTVLLSEGDFFECSLEPSDINNSLYLSGEFKEASSNSNKYILKFIDLFNKENIIYNIECEISNGKDFHSNYYKHPDY